MVVEDDVVFGTGALIAPNKRLRSGFLYVGAPAKQTRPLKPEEKEFLRYSAQHYRYLKDKYIIDPALK